MGWWTSARVHPKRKSNFLVNFGTFFLPNVKSITKPTVEFGTKEFKLINHVFNYPGTVKWSPVTIKFVCMNPRDNRDAHGNPVDKGLDTAEMLWQMIINSGYYYPTAKEHPLGHKKGKETTLTTPEKASMVANSFGRGLYEAADHDPGGSWSNASQKVVIQQINTTDRLETIKPGDEVFWVSEQWSLMNPMIKSINFGDLTYDSDDLVEYSLDIVYDYAEYVAYKEGDEYVQALNGNQWQSFSNNEEYQKTPAGIAEADAPRTTAVREAYETTMESISTGQPQGVVGGPPLDTNSNPTDDTLSHSYNQWDADPTAPNQ